MPEGVEVQIQVDGLQQIVGETFKKVEFADRGDVICRPLSSDSLHGFLSKERVERVFREGKYIVFALESGLYLATHLRMTGRYTIGVPEEDVGHTRVVFTFKSGLQLRYSDVRLFGRITPIRNLEVLKKGADALRLDSKSITSVLKSEKKHYKKPVKFAVRNQKTLAGVGNVYANEALFRAGINPMKKLGELSDSEFKKLGEEIRNVLDWGYKLGGLSLKDYYHVDGSRGKAQLYLNVYKATRCVRCSGSITRLEGKNATGVTYFCRRCQK